MNDLKYKKTRALPSQSISNEVKLIFLLMNLILNMKWSGILRKLEIISAFVPNRTKIDSFNLFAP